MTKRERSQKKLELLASLKEWLKMDVPQLLRIAQSKWANIAEASKEELIHFLVRHKLDEID
jgi:hypothetical protein